MAKARTATSTAKTASAARTASAAKTTRVRKVTFTLPKEAAPDAERVCLMGEFNEWSRVATPMRRRRDGDFYVTLELDEGRSYRFRYLVDDCKFENDWHADRYEPNPYGGEDSVIEI